MPRPVSAEAYIYALQRSDGAIKIGFSRDLGLRIKQLDPTGRESLKLRYYLARPRAAAHEIEKLCHSIARPHALGGEWFSISGDCARRTIDEAAARHATGERAPKGYKSFEPPKDKVILELSESLLVRLDNWRATQKPIPTKTSAVRDLVALALTSAGVPAEI